MNSSERDQERFDKLWADLIDGEIDESGIRELGGLMSRHREFLDAAADQFQIHRLLGVLLQQDPEFSEQFVQSTVERVVHHEDDFSSQVMKEILAIEAEADPVCVNPAIEKAPSRLWSAISAVSGWATAVAALVILGIVWLRSAPGLQGELAATHDSHDSAGSVRTSSSESPAIFSKLAQAQFFGELTPGVRTPLGLQRTYVLQSGMVELAFPQGALAIIEGPAVFRAQSADCLELDVGRCSVYAPEGAEGFRVDTPDAHVVDRGTRFSVEVNSLNETEVQVVEGMADLFGKATVSKEETPANSLPDFNGPPEYRLVKNQALRVHASKEALAEKAPFRESAYRHQLPDRIVSYDATRGDDGRVDVLKSVTVQRGGQEFVYAVEDLIPVKVVSFRSTDSPRGDYLIGKEVIPEQIADFLSDQFLTTGVINPGGSPVPLTSDPVLEADATEDNPATPGMGLKFQEPVRNGPGPDIVFFEVHPTSSANEGDAFHVSPLSLAGGRKSYTVRTYDLGLSSLDALPLTQMYVHFNNLVSVPSLAELMASPKNTRPARLDYRVLAVGIDLSDLGFMEGETADGIFIQDAELEGDTPAFRVDPVFVAGLP